VVSENGKSKTLHRHPNQISSGNDLTSTVTSFTAPLRKYRFIPRNKITHNKLVVPQILQKSPSFYETLKFITVPKRVHHPSLFWAKTTVTPYQSLSSNIHFNIILLSTKFRESSVGTATRYGLDVPGIQHPSRQALGPTQPPIQYVPGLFPGGKAAKAWR
jgi:hypothetical protein